MSAPKNPLQALRQEIQAQANPEQAAQAQRYFKTGPGEYGEGDRFLGLRVPAQRALARKYRELKREDLHSLLQSPWHEERLTAALILLEQYQRSRKDDEKTELYHFLIAQRAALNNWDLVDTVVPKIIGHYSLEHPEEIALLRQWIHSENLWERRMAMLASFAWVAAQKYELPLELARVSLADPHDLMHKATGWMLRELGKRDRAILEDFLEAHKHTMPRTMLRYAIEKFPAQTRQYYLSSSRQPQ